MEVSGEYEQITRRKKVLYFKIILSQFTIDSDLISKAWFSDRRQSAIN